MGVGGDGSGGLGPGGAGCGVPIAVMKTLRAMVNAHHKIVALRPADAVPRYTEHDPVFSFRDEIHVKDLNDPYRAHAVRWTQA